jgi:uncharacterized protein
MPNLSFEVPVEDLRRASAFYEQVFGWSMQHLPEVNYTLITASNDGSAEAGSGAGNIVGGMTPRTELVRAPVPIIGVGSIDDAVARVPNAGGQQLTEKEAVGDFGFSSYIRDSEGNVLCLWEDA